MLSLIDEAGDPGFKFDFHSSLHFTIGMVLFRDNEEALRCDKRINEIRQELRLPENYEFHYKKDSDALKTYFLKNVAPFDFFYYGIIINKKELSQDYLRIKDSFYNYACSLLFENAKDKLDNTTIVIDGVSSKGFEENFQRYLKNKFNTRDDIKIKKVKMQDSKKNNLLQLVDYVASGLHREFGGKRPSLLDPIKHREISVQVWPKN